MAEAPASGNQLLSADEERVLAERIKAGDTAAHHQLILANMNLVRAIVHDYKNCGLSLDDLVQEGNLGLIRASQDFDPVAYGNRFRTYASFWIRTSIHRALAANGSLLRRSHYVAVLRLRYRRALRELGGPGDGLERSDEQAQASLGRIAERMGVSLRKLKNARLARTDRNDSEARDAEGDSVPIEELAAVRQPPESDLINRENEELVHAALFRLSPFEAWVIRQRYGFRELPPEWYGWVMTRRQATATAASASMSASASETSTDQPGQAYYHRTYGEIGHDCGLSIHRVRQVEKAALDKLRRLLGPC